MDEFCDRCRRPAPPWTSCDYIEWEATPKADGTVAVICPGCLTQTDPLAQLTTLDDVREFVAEAYRAAIPPSRWSRMRPQPPQRFGFKPGRLPESVSSPGPLMAHAVRLSGSDGITVQELGDVVSVGKQRFEYGLQLVRADERISETKEDRPNRAGRRQRQVVLRWEASRSAARQRDLALETSERIGVGS